MFVNDITEKDIETLNDSQLRELMGKLCECVLMKHGIDTTAVTYGGKQEEPDGGVDIRVRSSSKFDDSWSIPRNNTIFQIKKCKMPCNKIEKEMQNSKKEIKGCIKELVPLKGAYIIVSSGESLGDLRLKERIECMKKIIKEIDIQDKVKVDFYDSKKIVSIVSQFPQLIIWVNDKLGKGTIGWKNYCNWSDMGKEEKEFIVDNSIFMHRENFKDENKLSIIEGINEIREKLSKERKSVRLAGLSGTGKTRLAQALFDKHVGKKELNKEEVIYCDIGKAINPVPEIMIQDLIVSGTRAIVIVDNCDRELHNILSRYVNYDESKLSLLTIEYDVKEDTNLDTYTYYLDTSSEDTIRKLLKRDFAFIADVNIETIVKCSNGNYRIAIFLASTIDKNESIGILTSEEIFKRLFCQNNKENDELLDVGRICSCFISFYGECDEKDKKNEIVIMSKIIEESPITLNQNIKELCVRKLIQERGKMKALLPGALSNRLAEELFSRMPTYQIIKNIKENERLELSLFRRLKYLHDKDYSLQIAKEYLDNMNFEKINKHDIELLHCIKVMLPYELLIKIEQIKDSKFFTRENRFFYDWSRILSYIAYDADYFLFAGMLLMKIAKTEAIGENYNSVREILYNLFHIVGSGTHAPLEERLKIVEQLVTDNNEIDNDIGIRLLEELLKTQGFFCINYEYMDSSRRDYGYFPKDNYERIQWYKQVLLYSKNLIDRNILKKKVKELLSKEFRLLTSYGLYYELEKIVEEVLEQETWPQIWVSISEIKYFDNEKMPKELLNRMSLLQHKCSPLTIDDKIEVFLKSSDRVYFDFKDIQENEKALSQHVYDLGLLIGSEKESLKKYLTMIDNSCRLSKMYDFMKGICEKYELHNDLIIFLLSNINENNENAYIRMISSYVALLKDTQQRDVILDNIMNHPQYRQYYPNIQFGYPLSRSDIERVKKSLQMQVSAIENYETIECYIAEIPMMDIIEVLKLFPKNHNSKKVLIQILFYLYLDNRGCRMLNQFTRKMVANLELSMLKVEGNMVEYELGELVKKAFYKEVGITQATVIFRKFRKMMKDNYDTYYDYKELLIPLVELYPIRFLESFIVGEIEEVRNFLKGFDNHENLMNHLDENLLYSWGRKNRKEEQISCVISPIEKKDGKYRWKKISLNYFEEYCNNNVIIDNLKRNIYPISWDNKYSTVLKERLVLAKELQDNEKIEVKKIGYELEKELKYNIRLREREEANRQERYNTFED